MLRYLMLIVISPLLHRIVHCAHLKIKLCCRAIAHAAKGQEKGKKGGIHSSVTRIWHTSQSRVSQVAIVGLVVSNDEPKVNFFTDSYAIELAGGKVFCKLTSSLKN